MLAGRALAEIAMKLTWTPPPPGGNLAVMSDIDIAFLVYPGMAALDLAGPYEVLQKLPGGRLHLVAKTTEPVVCDSGMKISPSATFAEVPRAQVLCVPGGGGQIDFMEDQPTLDWIRTVAADARWVTSVCTGSFLLGAAGLLRGYRATSHWASLPVLAAYGATVVEERVVVDRNRITAAGVTAGIDLALHVAARLASPTVAEAIQLALEYDPQPPFQSGHPRSASPALVEVVRARYADRVARREAQARRLTG
jgi:cyclohexyl-isocyanide hydratase